METTCSSTQNETPEVIYQDETPEVITQDETAEVIYQDDTPEVIPQDDTPEVIPQDETPAFSTQNETLEVGTEDETPEKNKNVELLQRDELFQTLADLLEPIMQEEEITVEELREVCYRYALKNEWVRLDVVSMVKGHLTMEDEEVDDKIWNAYLLGIQCSSNDLLKMKASEDESARTLYDLLTRSDFGDALVAPIPGSMGIEGKVISEVFDVVFNLEENKAKKRTLGEEDQYEEHPCASYNNQDDIYEDMSSYPILKGTHFGSGTKKKRGFGLDLSSLFTSMKAKPKPVKTEAPVEKIPEAIPKVVPDYNEMKMKVNDRLEKFVRFFVKEFETKLASYAVLSNGEALKDGDVEGMVSVKAGQILGKTVFGAIGGVAGALLGWPGAEAGMKFGSTVGEKVAEMINENEQNKIVKNIEDLIDFYLQEKSELIKMLVEVGCDIFQAYEMQLMGVSSERGVKNALHLLAMDAVSRMTNFLCKNRTDDISDLHYLLIEGLKKGKSRMTFLNLRSRGYDVTYESGNVQRKWTSGGFYGSVGVVKSGSFYGIRHGKSGTAKYGYRRLFRTEEWKEMEGCFNHENNRFEEYRYFLVANRMKSKAKKIFHRLDEKELEEERVKTIMRESKEEILEGITVLKGMHRDFSEDLKRLSDFESILKGFKIEECMSKLETHFENEVINHAKIDQLIEKMNEIDKKLDRLCQMQEDKFEII